MQISKVSNSTASQCQNWRSSMPLQQANNAAACSTASWSKSRTPWSFNTRGGKATTTSADPWRNEQQRPPYNKSDDSSSDTRSKLSPGTIAWIQNPEQMPTWSSFRQAVEAGHYGPRPAGHPCVIYKGTEQDANVIIIPITSFDGGSFPDRAKNPLWASGYVPIGNAPTARGVLVDNIQQTGPPMGKDSYANIQTPYAAEPSCLITKGSPRCLTDEAMESLTAALGKYNMPSRAQYKGLWQPSELDEALVRDLPDRCFLSGTRPRSAPSVSGPSATPQLALSAQAVPFTPGQACSALSLNAVPFAPDPPSATSTPRTSASSTPNSSPALSASTAPSSPGWDPLPPPDSRWLGKSPEPQLPKGCFW